MKKTLLTLLALALLLPAGIARADSGNSGLPGGGVHLDGTCAPGVTCKP